MKGGMTGNNAIAALERNPGLLSGRLGFIGLPGPDLPTGLDAEPGLPLVITEHAGVASVLEPSGRCHVSFGYDLPQQYAGALDTIVLFVPKARHALDMQLSLAGALLADGGHLVLVGEKREGIAGAARQLQSLAADARKVDSARHCPEVNSIRRPG